MLKDVLSKLLGKRSATPIVTPPSQLDVFVHVPKTGGSCIRTVLDQNYGPGEMFSFDGPAEHWRDFMEGRVKAEPSTRLLFGHVPFGVHEATGKPAKCVTMMREPLSRLVSDYLFALTGESGYNEKVTSEKMTFGDFAFGLGPIIQNVQSKWIAGIHPFEGEGISDDVLFDKALERLDSYLVVGLNEMLAPTMLLMAAAFGWKPPVFRSVNKSTMTAVLKNSLSSDVTAEVRRRNAVDFKLYDVVNDRFRRTLERQPPVFWKGLEEVVIANQSLDKGRTVEDLKRTFVPGRDMQSIGIDPNTLRNAMEFIRQGL